MGDQEAHEMLRKMSGAGGRPQDKYTIQEKDDKFTKERGPHILGVGATATVVLAKEEATGKLVAIKIIDLLQQGDKAALLKELRVQANIESTVSPCVRRQTPFMNYFKGSDDKYFCRCSRCQASIAKRKSKFSKFRRDIHAFFGRV